MGSVTTPERAEDSIEMARIVFGERFTDEHCVIMGNINMNSPLVYDRAMSGSLRAYARANQCPVVLPFILGGAFKEVGPGNHFFGCAHTLSRYETAFHECEIADTDSYENWCEAGGKDSMMRANAK